MKIRPYDHAADFDTVGQFLIESYVPGRTLRNWLEPRWQYMHYHPLIEGLPLEQIGEDIGVTRERVRQIQLDARPLHDRVGAEREREHRGNDIELSGRDDARRRQADLVSPLGTHR